MKQKRLVMRTIQAMLSRLRIVTMYLILFVGVPSSLQAAPFILSQPVALPAEVVTHLKSVRPGAGHRWQLVVFGFTHCKDICPMSLANLSMLVKAAAAEQIDLGGVFVTVDPDRDSHAQLASYIQGFGSDIAYLRFESEALAHFKATFGVEAVFFTKNAGNQSSYQVDHSTTAFLIDPAGRIRLIFDALEDAAQLAKLFRENRALFAL
ncbi:SCO family protein [Nitrosomonas sp. ANs5]|uniref:SCO family protein n=1 Tax=Nitrosomonas sp. ANs5 TaxID=3423941 RepID=UPI003D33A4E3